VFGFHRAMDYAGAVSGPVLASIFLFAYPGAYRSLFALTLIPGRGHRPARAHRGAARGRLHQGAPLDVAGFRAGLNLLTLVADLAPEGLRGTAFGLYHLTLGLGALVASVAVGAIWQACGAAAAFATGAALALAATAALFALVTSSEVPASLRDQTEASRGRPSP
jgi:hypothetical protein